MKKGRPAHEGGKSRDRLKKVLQPGVAFPQTPNGQPPAPSSHRLPPTNPVQLVKEDAVVCGRHSSRTTHLNETTRRLPDSRRLLADKGLVAPDKVTKADLQGRAARPTLDDPYSGTRQRRCPRTIRSRRRTISVEREEEVPIRGRLRLSSPDLLKPQAAQPL